MVENACGAKEITRTQKIATDVKEESAVKYVKTLMGDVVPVKVTPVAKLVEVTATVLVASIARVRAMESARHVVEKAKQQ